MSTALFHPAVVRTEFRLFRREPGSVFWILLFPALLLGVLGSLPSFRQAQDGLGGLRTVDVYVPVCVLVALVMAGVQAMPPALTGYRELGILRRLSVTPVRPASLLAAQMLVNGVAALASALITLAAGRLAHGVRLPGQPAGYLLALLLAVAAALALGALIAARARTTKSAAATGTAAVFPMLFCAGVWVPVPAMPDVLARVVVGTPFGAAARALDQAAAGRWPDWGLLGVLAAWTAVLSVSAARWFRWE
ncbi:ABC transporter permease [Streptomyces sp. NPDC006624]|uniref:ABC transporter permease n=1 Tax=unclassified Streptomyces TaxID=2593676 RepID=UPI0033B83850